MPSRTAPVSAVRLAYCRSETGHAFSLPVGLVQQVRVPLPGRGTGRWTLTRTSRGVLPSADPPSASATALAYAWPATGFGR